MGFFEVEELGVSWRLEVRKLSTWDAIENGVPTRRKVFI